MTEKLGRIPVTDAVIGALAQLNVPEIAVSSNRTNYICMHCGHIDQQNPIDTIWSAYVLHDGALVLTYFVVLSGMHARDFLNVPKNANYTALALEKSTGRTHGVWGGTTKEEAVQHARAALCRGSSGETYCYNQVTGKIELDTVPEPSTEPTPEAPF